MEIKNTHKCKQQVEVDWMFVPEHSQGQQEDQGAQSRNQNHSRTEGETQNTGGSSQKIHKRLTQAYMYT